MQIRKASANDIEGVNNLLRQVLMVHHNGRPDLFKPNAKKYTDEELLAIFENDKTPVFVAVDKEKILAYAFCVHTRHIDDNILTDIKTLYIDDICVDENERGHNVGRAIYDYVINYAKENDYYNVTLNVWSCNPGAISFYEKMGLTPYKIGMEKILKDEN